MKLVNIKKGMRVSDRWWPWSVGTVAEVLKTRVRIQFGSEVVTYDAQHVQFLEVA